MRVTKRRDQHVLRRDDGASSRVFAGRLMNDAYVPEFGPCPCGGSYESRRVEVRMTVHGELLTFSDVPQGACPLCGSRVYRRDVLAAVEAAMRGD